MMKFVVLFVAVVAIVGAMPAPEGPSIATLTRSEIRDDHGQFSLSYSADNGIAVSQQGALKPIQTENGLENVLVQQGRYAFVAPDGQVYELSYIADENGFQPSASYLPTPPTAPAVPDVPAVPVV